ncbi:hypothetical protein AVEN_25582-1 [Araneus ventricosus]|uniref:Uncharacterized protein n=1 Tax=Araneus ventricosus TaxID=182803 RepID=A0A4Y2IKS4_ARAVE|nr:hypothetical protein AVEN_25582-1 [Araneus ventricosus]
MFLEPIVQNVSSISPRIVIRLDKEICFPTFTTVLIALMGTFSNGYKKAFHTYESPEYAIPFMCAIAMYVSYFLFKIIPASITNEAAEEIRCFVRSLPCRFPD